MFRKSFRKEIIVFVLGACCFVALQTNTPAADEFTLLVWVSDNCPPCDAWKKQAYPTLKEIDDLKIKIYENQSGVVTPCFSLQRADKTSSWRGYANWKTHRQHLVDAIAKVIGVPSTEVLACCRPTKQCRPIFATPVRSFLWALFRPIGYVPVRPPPRPYVYTPPAILYQPPSVIYYR